MNDGGVGRLLVASLHQGIADVLPTRLDFYEAWLSPAGLRDGRIGLAPLAAVLSFLRQEGASYHVIVARAGEYTADWVVADLPSFARRAVDAAPRAVRLWYVMRLARRMVRQTYGGSRAIVRWRWRGDGAVDIRGSVFCGVRDRAPQPLCEFYLAAIRRLLEAFALDLHVDSEQCRATGAERCMFLVGGRPQERAQ